MAFEPLLQWSHYSNILYLYIIIVYKNNNLILLTKQGNHLLATSPSTTPCGLAPLKAPAQPTALYLFTLPPPPSHLNLKPCCITQGFSLLSTQCVFVFFRTSLALVSILWVCYLLCMSRTKALILINICLLHYKQNTRDHIICKLKQYGKWKQK